MREGGRGAGRRSVEGVRVKGDDRREGGELTEGELRRETEEEVREGGNTRGGEMREGKDREGRKLREKEGREER